MGKKKNKKFGAPKPQPTGLPSVNGDENELVNDSSSSVIADVLDQLQSAEESTRECGCGTLAALAAQSGALPMLLGNNVVRILAPLVIDPSPYVRHRALGALRNMTVDGGLDVCEEMVLKDVLTPIVALFNQYGANWEPEKSQTKYTDTRLDTFTQAVHVLWNLCEASDIAVTVVNKVKLLPLLLPCLQHAIYGYSLATAVAQCLQTVTEGNKEAIELCRGDDVLLLLKGLTDKTDSSSQAMLFQVALMGILMNVLGEELTNSPSLSAFVVTLSQILDVSGASLLANYTAKKPQQNGAAQAGPSGDEDQHGHTLMEEDTAPTDSDYRDIINTVDAQRLCLELVTNMCCSPDEEWEEIDSSESGSSDEMSGAVGMAEDISEDNNNFDGLSAHWQAIHVQCPGKDKMFEDIQSLFTYYGENPIDTPLEVHAAFVANRIVDKVLRLSLPLPAELLAEISTKKWGKKTIEKWARLRTLALLCVNNLMETIPVEALEGSSQDILQQLWDTLEQQAKMTASGEGATPLPLPSTQAADTELLEAATSAFRAIVQKLAQVDCPKIVEVLADKLQFLVQLADRSPSSVQIHIIRIVAGIALLLVKTDPSNAVVQEVGEGLVTAATHSTDLVVVAEALDALFDVFAEDATDPVAFALHLPERLRAILPQLKAKLQNQKKSLGENFVTVKTARTNLIRFITYLESKAQ